jgi:hypothetical protein
MLTDAAETQVKGMYVMEVPVSALRSDRGMGGNESRETGLRAFVLSKP